MMLGVDKIKEMTGHAKFALVSSDLYQAETDKPLFPTFHKWTGPQGTVTVIALSGAVAKGTRTGVKGIRVKNAKEAVEKALAQAT
jgi:hypothetical protein